VSLALQQAWRTLRHSPLAFVLTVVLLAAAAFVPWFARGGFGNQQEAAPEIPFEFELASGHVTARDSIVNALRKLNKIQDLVTLSPGDVRREVLAELGDSLADILSERDFPAIVRFKLAARNVAELQTFAAKWSRAPGVVRVVYPEEIALNRLPEAGASPAMDRTKLWVIAGTSWVLAGLCLRAVFLRRRATWRLFIWLGCSPAMMFFVRLWLGLFVSVCAAVVWCLASFAARSPMAIEYMELGTGLLWAVLLGLTASLWLVGTGRLEAEG